MAIFRIEGSRRLGLDRCEFDVGEVRGEIRPLEYFAFMERGTAWEYVILDVKGRAGGATLLGLSWIPEDGAFVGFEVTSRPMKSVQRKRWAKMLPALTK
jgi:hypothetical protein